MKRIKQLLQSEKPIKWVFTGDSITHGVVHTFGKRDYVQLFEERIRCEMQRVFDLVIRTAISGWTTKNMMDNLDWAVHQFNPDVVSIMLGMNDACDLEIEAFSDNYNHILDEISAKTDALIFLHTPNPVMPDTEPVRTAHLPDFAERVRAIAAERQLPLIDHWAEWAEAWLQNPFRAYAWMTDAIHPGVFGHRAFARLMMKEFGIWDDTSLCGKLAIP